MFSLIIWGLAGVALANEDPSPAIAQCGLPPQAKVVLEVQGLPGEIQTDLKSLTPDLAPRDSKFQRDDIIREPNLPKRRFVGAVSSNGTWVVLYEHGVENHIHAIRFSPRGIAASRRFFQPPNGNLIGDMCPMISASFSGVFAADKGHY